MENKHGKSKADFGLIGRNIDYSFSRAYFKEKFEKEQLPYIYVNFDIENISSFFDLLKEYKDIKGFNVTIPYKEEVIPYLDSLDKTADDIGAVNTIKIHSSGKKEGFNTDYYGFQKSITPFLKPHHQKALILGTGGASKAVAYAFKNLNISYEYVSRSKRPDVKFQYNDLDEALLKQYQIIVNCSPVGTFPNINASPDVPYNGIGKTHLLFDLIYNPEETEFLRKGRLNGATTCNGSKMLQYQAEKAWEIWTKIN